MSGCSTSAGNEVKDPNYQDALPVYANLSKTSDHCPLRDDSVLADENNEGRGNGIENVPEEEDEDEDADFNPFLKENNSVEASSSLSSEVEDAADSRKEHIDSMGKYKDSMTDCQTSGNVSEEVVMQTTVSSKESVLITHSETGSLCEKDNGSIGVTDISSATDSKKPAVYMDAEGAICMRTRARYSLASITLDELENFLQESDDEDDLQNVDDEEEYRKFLAAVLRGDESENILGNANADDEDEDNDADFELELEEALESEPEEEVEERRMTRRSRCHKVSLERSKKLRPLLPFASIGSFPKLDGQQLIPNNPSSYMPPANNGVTFGFTPHQIGQLHCLIHEHVQLLIQVFSLCVLEPVKSNVAAEVKELVVEMVRKHDQALAWRTVPYPSFCFLPPCVHPSVSDGKMLPTKDSNGDVQCDARLPDELAGCSQTPESTSWVPYVCGPVLSVMDVAPLRLVENYMDDVSSAVRAFERYQMELGFESCCQKEPLFPFHNFLCAAESDDQGETDNNTPDSSGMLCSSSPNNQMAKKTMAATLLEKAKNQPIALVPKEIAKLAQRFWPLFNPALYPHKPPPAAIVNRVLFTDAEDELLALGLMEYNTDWKAIQQRFLPCKSRHQIFVRQKNRASSKAPENPIKAVRRMKNSPLTSEEIARIETGLKRFKLDWISIWRSFVPYRDPSLLPRQWRIACGTQKSYKSDANKKAKRHLYELRRKPSKPSRSNCHSSSEKEGNSTDNAVEETNSGDNRIDKEDEAYVHEAFLADDNNVSSSFLTCMPSHNGSIQPQIHSKPPPAFRSQVVLRPYRARKQNSARLVKLAPDLPPVNLPPSVRVMSQSAFKSSQTVASSKNSSNAFRIADLAGSSIKSRPSRGDSDLQMHPLLFQAPQNGHLPYYPMNCSTSTSSSFAFFQRKQPQLSLGLFHNPRHVRDAVNFLEKSPKPPEKNVPSSGVDFHPLLQRSDDVGTHSVVESRQRRASTQNREGNELDLDIHLSFTSKKQEAAERSNTTTRGKDSGKKRDFARDGTSAELSSGDIPLVTCRNKGVRKVSDTMGDESLPGIIMEQEELSDSEEEFGENVEFECEEMDDSEGDGMSDSEKIANLRNEELQLDEMDADIDAQMLNTQSTSGGHSSGLLEESTEKGVNLKPNISSLNLNSHPPISPLSNPTNVTSGYEFGPFGTTGAFDQSQLFATSKGSGDTLPRNPRKRVRRSNSNTNVDMSVEKLED